MSLLEFAQAYSALTTGEQSQFADAVRRLLADGLVWRDHEDDRRAYAFLARRRELAADWLAVAGFELRFHERTGIFQVGHQDGAHRRRLNGDTTTWLLIARLLYAEGCERLAPDLPRHPVVTVGDFIGRYIGFFPAGKRIRKKGSLDEALRTLHALKLIRPARGGVLHAANSEQLVELLPTLEVVVPAEEIAALASRLAEYAESGQAPEGEQATHADAPDEDQPHNEGEDRQR